MWQCWNYIFLWFRIEFHSKYLHLHDCSIECVLLGVGWHWVQCSNGGILGNSWMCVCIRLTGDCCAHAPIHRQTHTNTQMHAYRQLCSVWKPGERIYPAFPSRCQSRQPSFDSLTFQFYPPAPAPRVSPLPLLPFSRSFFPLQVFYSLSVLESNPRPVNHCILLPH